MKERATIRSCAGGAVIKRQKPCDLDPLHRVFSRRIAAARLKEMTAGYGPAAEAFVGPKL